MPDFVRLLEADREARYERVDASDEADLTLIVNCRVQEDRRPYEALRRHDAVRRCLPNAFVYIEDDDPRCVYQGLYCSMPRRWFNRDRQRAVPYRRAMNWYVAEASREPDLAAPQWLASFAGQTRLPVRQRIAAIRDPRFLIRPTDDLHIFDRSRRDPEAVDRAMREYVDLIRASKFVLCPRGAGTSSFRLFETLALGRVPVILSDQWVPPEGPDWSKICLHVAEDEATHLPHILEDAEAQWPTMAQAVHQAYHDSFAPCILFHRMVEVCLEIGRQKRIPEKVWRLIPDRQKVVYRAQGLLRRIRRATRGRAPRVVTLCD